MTVASAIEQSKAIDANVWRSLQWVKTTCNDVVSYSDFIAIQITGYRRRRHFDRIQKTKWTYRWIIGFWATEFPFLDRTFDVSKRGRQGQIKRIPWKIADCRTRKPRHVSVNKIEQSREFCALEERNDDYTAAYTYDSVGLG